MASTFDSGDSHTADQRVGFSATFAIAAFAIAVAVRVGAGLDVPRLVLGIVAVGALGLALAWSLALEDVD